MMITDDDAEMRLRVRLDYRQFIDDLNSKYKYMTQFLNWFIHFSLANRQLYTAPDNDELEKKIDQVDQAFAKGENLKKINLKKTKNLIKNFS